MHTPDPSPTVQLPTEPAMLRAEKALRILAHDHGLSTNMAIELTGQLERAESTLTAWVLLSAYTGLTREVGMQWLREHGYAPEVSRG